MKQMLFAYLVASVATAYAAPVEADFGRPVSSSLTVHYPNGGTSFRPGPEELDYLSGASDAALVVIRGRTSTARPSAHDERLALERALAARAYLVAHGVSPLKISVNFASAADFVVDNSTTEGRRQNQRVEIELIYVMVNDVEAAVTAPQCAGVRAVLGALGSHGAGLTLY